MAASHPKPGDVLGGKYRIERVLGSGGMGMVLGARHIELGQRVAIKLMLRESLGDSGQVERFLREARAAVQLKSPHTARVLDVAKLADGEPFIVMEYLEGRDLHELLQQAGPLASNEAVEFMLQASEAIAEAHGLGIIHRDIKLRNLFLTRSVDDQAFVKVLDFGLAKTISVGGDVSLTASSAVFGSPQYMSPEQMRSAKDVDARSDIWSIGCCLYELITGRVPFNAPGLAEICAMVLKDPVVPPSAYAEGLPIDLELAILRCLEKDPAKRFQSVAELAFAVEGFAHEGTGKRLLQVMASAQRDSSETVVEASFEEEVGPTVGAWSGAPDPNGLDTQTRERWRWGAWGGAAGAVLAAGVAAAVVLTINKRAPLVASDAPVASTSLQATSTLGVVTAPVAAPASSPVATAPSSAATAGASVTLPTGPGAAPLAMPLSPSPAVGSTGAKKAPVSRPSATLPARSAAPEPTTRSANPKPGDKM